MEKPPLPGDAPWKWQQKGQNNWTHLRIYGNGTRERAGRCTCLLKGGKSPYRIDRQEMQLKYLCCCGTLYLQAVTKAVASIAMAVLVMLSSLTSSLTMKGWEVGLWLWESQWHPSGQGFELFFWHLILLPFMSTSTLSWMSKGVTGGFKYNGLEVLKWGWLGSCCSFLWFMLPRSQKRSLQLCSVKSCLLAFGHGCPKN